MIRIKLIVVLKLIFVRLPCCFKYYDLDTRRIFKYFLNINYLALSEREHSEYSGLDIFGPGVPAHTGALKSYLKLQQKDCLNKNK